MLGTIEKRVMEVRRQIEADQENSLYLFVINSEYQSRPQDIVLLILHNRIGIVPGYFLCISYQLGRY